MNLYYSNLCALEQQTHQLQHEHCRHCQRKGQLLSHGYRRKKRPGGRSLIVGKRVFCSNRHSRLGCGRTMQLYLAQTIRAIHYASTLVMAFVFSLIRGETIAQAYRLVNKFSDPRQAYRWLNTIISKLSFYRCLLHQPLRHGSPLGTTRYQTERVRLLAETFQGLMGHFGASVCSSYQLQQQASFF